MSNSSSSPVTLPHDEGLVLEPASQVRTHRCRRGGGVAGCSALAQCATSTPWHWQQARKRWQVWLGSPLTRQQSAPAHQRRQAGGWVRWEQKPQLLCSPCLCRGSGQTRLAICLLHHATPLSRVSESRLAHILPGASAVSQLAPPPLSLSKFSALLHHAWKDVRRQWEGLETASSNSGG